jgi:hypothetical protein
MTDMLASSAQTATSTPPPRSPRTIAGDFLPSLFAFSFGLGLAYFFRWETRDLVWSLWLSSLVIGYLTILSVLATGVVIALRVTTHEDIKPGHRLPVIFCGVILGLFFLAFFSFHFCGFHAGHSVFLNHFFPVEGLPSFGFGSAFMNPLLLWILVFEHLLKPYGLFLIPALIVEWRNVFGTLISAFQACRIPPAGETDGTVLPVDPSKMNIDFGQAIARPYSNVVRMHLLIFFFAACYFLKVDSFVVYAIVSLVYFFPWSAVAPAGSPRKP